MPYLLDAERILSEIIEEDASHKYYLLTVDLELKPTVLIWNGAKKQKKF